jgi:hypothetical protein
MLKFIYQVEGFKCHLSEPRFRVLGLEIVQKTRVRNPMAVKHPRSTFTYMHTFNGLKDNLPLHILIAMIRKCQEDNQYKEV